MNSKRLLSRWQLNGHDRRKLATALRRCADGRHVRRLQAVLLLAQGRPAGQVSSLTGLSRQTAYNALAKYLVRRDPADLADGGRVGRPRVARRVSGRLILAALKRDPLALGYNATAWTVDLLSRHLSERLGQAVGPRTLRRRMRDLGLRWKRPRYAFKAPDPHRGQKKGASAAA
jgi:transposase